MSYFCNMADLQLLWHPDDKQMVFRTPRLKTMARNHGFFLYNVDTNDIVAKKGYIEISFALKHKWDDKYYDSIRLN